MTNDLTEQEIKVITKLRQQGFAVVLFNPEELEGASPDNVEDRLIELGWDVISVLRTENIEEE